MGMPCITLSISHLVCLSVSEGQLVASHAVASWSCRLQSNMVGSFVEKCDMKILS